MFRLLKIDDQFEMYLFRWAIGQSGDKYELGEDRSRSRHLCFGLSRPGYGNRACKKAAEEFGKQKDDQLKQGVERMEIPFGPCRSDCIERTTPCRRKLLWICVSHWRRLGLITEFFINVLAYNYYPIEVKRFFSAVLNKSIELFPQSSAAFETLDQPTVTFAKKTLHSDNYRKVWTRSRQCQCSEAAEKVERGALKAVRR